MTRLRLLARERAPSPRPSLLRYVRHNMWHVCHYTQYLPPDSGEWIEVTW